MIETGRSRELVLANNAELNESDLLNPFSRELEKGSVEAGLVLIPTTLFFLLVVQIIIAGSWQVLERSNLHDLVIRSKILNEDIAFVANENLALVSDLTSPSEGEWSNGASRVGTPSSRTPTQRFKSESSARNHDRNLSVISEDSFFGQVKKYELTSSIPILGDFFAALLPGAFKVRNYAVTVS